VECRAWCQRDEYLVAGVDSNDHELRHEVQRRLPQQRGYREDGFYDIVQILGIVDAGNP